jgi:hypothetical protein
MNSWVYDCQYDGIYDAEREELDRACGESTGRYINPLRAARSPSTPTSTEEP